VHLAREAGGDGQTGWAAAEDEDVNEGGRHGVECEMMGWK
jgi:hypothetical protein